jgi:nucleoside-diphosphate-sugar epimerase
MMVFLISKEQFKRLKILLSIWVPKMGIERSVLVLGGNGFVGQAFCRAALERGWRVSSLSRSGSPANPPNNDLLEKVTWYRGSALDPTSFSINNLLENVDYLIHCIGILLPEKSPHRSYHELSVETAKVAIEAAKEAHISGIAYISAANFGKAFTSLLPGYYSSKSEAEEYLETQQRYFDKMVVARPSLMWGEGRWLSKPISLFYNIATFFAAGIFPRALPVTTVANSILNALEDDTVKGFRIFEVPQLNNPN